MPTFWNPHEVDAKTVQRVRGWHTQEQFAAAMRVTRRTVIRWEQHGAKFDRYAPKHDADGLTPWQRFCRLAKERKVELQGGLDLGKVKRSSPSRARSTSSRPRASA